MSFFRTRFNCVVMVMIVLMVLLLGRLFAISVIQNERWTAEAANLTVQRVFLPAPRGEIFDRHGRLLAGNVQTFSLMFVTTNLSNAQANEIATTLVGILEANGDEMYDNFPIVIKNGRLRFTFDIEIEEWLYNNDLPLHFNAERAFNAIRERYGVPEWYDQFEAQLDLQNRLNVHPPISVRNMEFLRNMGKATFLQRYNLRADLTAEEAFDALRLRFGIDTRARTADESGERPIIRSDISNEEARKILVIRNEVFALGYRRYVPATIASNISPETIIQVAEMNRFLPGVEIMPDTKRIYPEGMTAAHIVGYMGRISERDLSRFMEDPRYRPHDFVGLDGIEHAKESVLKGTPGIREVQVNARGELVRVLTETDPIKGRDIFLTIDLDLQRAVEEALARGLHQMQVGGTFESVHGNFRFTREAPRANVGAVVVTCVRTGEILAMASYPSFDPNEFVGGISREAWAALQSQNPRDPLAPIPLYNVAARSAQMPGSAFKMVTAAAAVSSGLNPANRLTCSGYVMTGNREFGCLVWNRFRGTCGRLNLAEAIAVSCNVFFYNIGIGAEIGRDDTRRSLGFEMDTDVITRYAAMFGLGVPTGIEIRETRAAIPTEASRERQIRSALTNVLRLRADMYFIPEVTESSFILNQNISEIVDWMSENPSRAEIIRRLPGVGIKDYRVVEVADMIRFDYFNRARWTRGDILNMAIGQGDLQFTPLQMANFMATLGNRGVRNDLTLISAIEGMQIERAPAFEFELQNGDFEEIIRGTRLVTQYRRGTLHRIFQNFPIEVAAKTGTAEREGSIHPPCEIEYVQTYLRRIAPQLTWEEVEAEMNRLMTEFPDRWQNPNAAVRRALLNLDDSLTFALIDAHKPYYDPFAWVVAMAPANEPQIAVSVLIFQGGTSLNAGPIAREVISEFFQFGREFEDINLNSTRM